MHVVIYLLVFTEGEDGPTFMTDVDNKKNKWFLNQLSMFENIRNNL